MSYPKCSTCGMNYCIHTLEAEIESLKEVLDDTRRLTRELDVAMSGEENAAKQASLCDLIPQAKRTRLEVESLKAEIAADDRNVNALMDQVHELSKEKESLKAQIQEARGFLKHFEKADGSAYQAIKAQLAECRDKALEEAAEIIDAEIDQEAVKDGWIGSSDRALVDCATAIRSLKGAKP